MNILYSAHRNSPKENIGDVLSAIAISRFCGGNNNLFVLPDNAGFSSQSSVIYGGGGMIRPYFATREIYKNFCKNQNGNEYIICGVGLNRDEMVRNFSYDDLCALKEWVFGAKKISVRDTHTQLFLEDFLDYNKSVLSPCPTYVILRMTKVSRVIKRLYRVGIVSSFGHTSCYLYYLPKIVKLVVDLANTIGDRNVSIICHDKQDYEFAHKLFASRNIDICLPGSFSQVKYEYSKCSKIVALRGHGLIFSAACDIPCSVVSLNIKMDTLFHYHYGVRSLGLNFNADEHLYFLRSMIKPKLIYIPSKATLI